MLKKILTGTGIAGVLTLGIIIGSLTLGPVFAHTQDNTTPVQAVVQGVDDDATKATVQCPDLDDVEEQQPQYTGSILVDEAQYEGMNEADETAALQNGEYLYALQMMKIVGIVWIIILIFGAFVSVIKPWGRIGKTKDEVEPSPVGTT